MVDPEMICSKIRKKTMRELKVLSQGPNAVTSLQMSTEELHVNMHCQACAQQLRKIILKMRGVQKVETELSSGKVTVTGTTKIDQLVEYVYRRTRKQAKILSQTPKGEEEEEKKEDEGAMKTEEKPVEDQEKKEEGKKEEKKEEGERRVEENKDEEKKESEETKSSREEEMKEEEVGDVAPVGGGTLEDELNKKMMYWATPLNYVVEQAPLPQLFSYENSTEQTSLPQLFSDENSNACSIS